MRLKKFDFMVFILFFLIVSLIFYCGKKEPEVHVPPWLNNEYSDLSDSALQVKVDMNDTLAAMTLAWKHIEKGNITKAANLLLDFNKFFDKSSPDLNYITSYALIMDERDTLAIPYLDAIKNNEKFPEIKYYLAQAHKKKRNFDSAIKIYKELKNEAPHFADSILACQAEMNDTLAGIELAMKALESNNIKTALIFFSRYVSKEPGVSPPSWYYGAGRSMYEGNNFERAALYFENARADTSFPELSAFLGMSYYEQKLYDTSIAYFQEALQMGDKSAETYYLMSQAQFRMGLFDEAVSTSNYALSMYPEDERFYFLPARSALNERNGMKLLEIANNGLAHIEQSYRLDGYQMAGYSMIGNSEAVDSLLPKYIEKYKFTAHALSETTVLFRDILENEEIAEILDSANYETKYPGIGDFFYWYNANIEDGFPDRARAMLDEFLTLDTIEERKAIARELYKRDFPEYYEE